MKKRFSILWIRLVFNMFFVLVLTSVVFPALLYFLVNNQIIELSSRKGLLPTPLLLLLLFSLISGTIAAAHIVRKRIKPMTKLNEEMQRVATGDFSIRMDENNYHLETREMVKSFNKMVQELGGIETFRNDFIANVSHEFKTPISSIEGYATLLQDENLSYEEQMEYSQLIIDSAKQLSSLSDSILKISKLENQEIVVEKTTFSLDEQIRQSLLTLEILWTGKNIDIDLELPETTYYGSEELLAQVWYNLFSNAVKYTPENGTIVATLKKTDDTVIVSISDTGIGMSQETMVHAFDKFYQGDKTRFSEGSGLGLTLVKRIVDISGGTITIKSKLGKGSAFTITLPILLMDR